MSAHCDECDAEATRLVRSWAATSAELAREAATCTLTVAEARRRALVAHEALTGRHLMAVAS